MEWSWPESTGVKHGRRGWVIGALGFAAGGADIGNRREGVEPERPSEPDREPRQSEARQIRYLPVLPEARIGVSKSGEIERQVSRNGVGGFVDLGYGC